MNHKNCDHISANNHPHFHKEDRLQLRPNYLAKLRLAAILAFFYFIINILGSFFSGSLALLADAGHKLVDLSAISLALLASHLAYSLKSNKKTFGLYRAEVLAALLNSVLLFWAGGYVLFEAWQRFQAPSQPHIEGQVMLLFSVFGLLINVIAALTLFPSRKENLNVKGAFIHVATDVANSFAEIITAISIYYFAITWLDTVLSGIIACVVIYNATSIFKEAIQILMEVAPQGISPEQVKTYLLNQPDVEDVHDLHLWSITTGRNGLLAHVRVAQNAFRYEQTKQLEDGLRQSFDLCHITLQLEPVGFQEEPAPF